MKHDFLRMRSALTSGFALAGAVAATACSAQSTQTVHSSTVPLSLTNWAQNLTVPQFNGALGTLTSVTVSLNWTSYQSISVSNNDNSGKIDPDTGMPYPAGQTQYVYADEGVNVVISYPNGGSLTGGLLVGAPADLMLGSLDIFGDAAGPVPANTSQSVGPVTTALTTNSTAITDGATLALYTGSGTVSFAASGDGSDTLQDSGGNVEWAAGTMAGASVTVVYTYTPSMNCSVGQTSINSNFNGTAIAAGNYIWFNSVLKPSGLSKTAPTTFHFINQTISFTSNGVPYVTPGAGLNCCVYACQQYK